MKKTFLFLLTIFAFISQQTLYAESAEIIPDTHEFIKAVVVKSEFKENRLMFASTTRDVYDVTVALPDGTEKTFENDHFNVSVGTKVYVSKRTDLDGVVTYSMDEPVRTPILFVLGGLFVFLSIWIGGKQGAKGLISLVGSVFLLFLILVPSILKGYSPVLVSLIVASIIIVLGSFITHGFNRTTSSAVLGMVVTVCGVGVGTIFLM